VSDPRVERVLADLGAPDMSLERREHLESLVARLIELLDADETDDNLKVAATVLGEFADAAAVFSPWRQRPKFTVYGSARTAPDHPLYQMAVALGAAMSERGWITVAGGGPGIMEGAARGAGREDTLGVNIDLPFEQSSNPYVDADTRLVEMKYFFSRKVALTRESRAFAIFPGGLGTMDECFELLTLLHTGKTPPAPVVLLDRPDGRFWDDWRAFLERDVVEGGYLDPGDLVLVRQCDGVESAVAEIERFHSRYRGFARATRTATVLCEPEPGAEEVAALAARFPEFDRGLMAATAGGLAIAFDGRSYVALRRLIDALNDLA
jgi:uncharacterized protein (TIGR00730 family)